MIKCEINDNLPKFKQDCPHVLFYANSKKFLFTQPLVIGETGHHTAETQWLHTRGYTINSAFAIEEMDMLNLLREYNEKPDA